MASKLHSSTTHIVSVKTGDKKGAGTDGNVRIQSISYNHWIGLFNGRIQCIQHTCIFVNQSIYYCSASCITVLNVIVIQNVVDIRSAKASLYM